MTLLGRCIGMVGVGLLLVACGDDSEGSGTDGSSETDSTSGSSVSATTDDGTTGGTTSADATGSDSTSDDGGDTTEGEGSSGDTGEVEEGPFADVYRIAVFETDLPNASRSFWVDADADGASEPVSLLPGGDHGLITWSQSPSRRWLMLRGGSGVDGQGWVVDAEAIDGGTPDTWAFGFGLTSFNFGVFFDGEDGLAYVGQSGASARVYAHTLGDGVGPAVEIQSTAANASWLALGGDTLVFSETTREIHTAPAEATAATSVHVANATEDNVAPGYHLAADGSAVYVRDVDGWYISALDPADPPTLSPIALPPEEPGVIRRTDITDARNHLVVIDYDGISPLPDPIHVIALDGPTASAPVSVDIPSGGGGAATFPGPQYTADGNTMYVAASAGDDQFAAYAIDLTGPAVTVVAGPGVDDSSVGGVYLSHDEQRLFYPTRSNPLTVKMVDLAGDPTPIDLAPGFTRAYGIPDVTLVESEDGRAVYFLGQAELTDGVAIWRVGIVDGEATDPVRMADPDPLTIPLQFYPAPDGGGLAYLLDGDGLWFSIYDGGMPFTQQLSTEGFLVERSRPPLFLPLSR